MFCCLQITDEDLKGGRADRDFFAYHASTARSPVFINSREVTGRFLLDPGSYLIIPTTFEPGHNGDFLVRIYSEKPVTSSYVSLFNSCCTNTMSMGAIGCPPPFPLSFHCFISVLGACFSLPHGGSWLRCQDLPAMGATRAQELALILLCTAHVAKKVARHICFNKRVTLGNFGGTCVATKL